MTREDLIDISVRSYVRSWASDLPELIWPEKRLSLLKRWNEVGEQIAALSSHILDGIRKTFVRVEHGFGGGK